ncbi:MAG: FHA domain-containing protein [Mastigocoleus sp.]
MIVCPNCNHPNPDGAVQCEACYTPLPTTTNCPNCGATVQADASFCGQCGHNLRSASAPGTAATVAPDIPMEVPPLVNPDPLVEAGSQSPPITPPTVASEPVYPEVSSALPPTAVAAPNQELAQTPLPEQPLVPPPSESPEISLPPDLELEAVPELETTNEENSSPPETPELAETQVENPEPPPTATPASPAGASRTQLQQISASLEHIQSGRDIELPQNLSVIHIGKPNDRIPPDIDVSGFSNSEIVSRIHSDIRVEGDAYYIEDVGSSNGTYINNLPLLPGNRHRLRPGDRISLGKGDLMTFLFQLS